MKKHLLIFIALACLALVFFSNTKDNVPQDLPNPAAPIGESKPEIEIIAENLNIPWDLEFLPASPAGGPDGRFLVTERPGNLLIIGQNREVIKVEGVRHTGEGGLLGLALHPDFSQNNFIYLYLTSTENNRTENRVERYKLIGSALSERTVIISGIRGSSVHDGGQVAFGPDRLLYISTGDAGQGTLAQDKNSLNGKILRVRDDGSIPDDNPFGNAVYSYGHRNPQGLAWDDRGQLWAAEHGPSGIDGGRGQDELNLIEKGKNYGWPIIKGDATREGMESPVIHSGTSETWAPSGLAFWDGRLFFAGLRGETLYAYNPDTGETKKYFAGEYGRLRAVVAGPEGLYITTSNRDGRGRVRSGDDRLILWRSVK